MCVCIIIIMRAAPNNRKNALCHYDLSKNEGIILLSSDDVLNLDGMNDDDDFLCFFQMQKK